MIELTQHRRDCKCEECYECPKCEELQELLDYATNEMEDWIDGSPSVVEAFEIRDLIKRLKGAL